MELIAAVAGAQFVECGVESLVFPDIFNGHPCLGDISLLDADVSLITRRDTLGYGTPSCYVGGLPDIYGVAAILWPPQT